MNDPVLSIHSMEVVMKSIQSILAVVLLSLISTNALGQYEIQIQSSLDLPGEVLLMNRAVEGAITSNRVFYSTVGWGNASGFGILNDSNVRRDLELLDDQFEQISRIRKEFNSQISDLKNAIKKNPDKAKDLSISIKKARKEQDEAIKEVLLPHQQERLAQVRNQLQLESMGTSHALQNGEFAKALNITAEQKKELAELQKELQKEIQEKMKQLKEKAKKKMLEKLTPEQRLKFKQMTGDEFKRKK